MTKILLIRHGEAAKAPGVADPPLTERGLEQAEALAHVLGSGPRFHLVSSPKSRARQTAEPLAQLWQREIAITGDVTEIPSPPDLPLTERGQWIRSLLVAQWSQLQPHQLLWREGVIDYLSGLQQDTAVFCHFMVINSVVAHIRGASDICQFRPDYTSITELELRKGRLLLTRLGREKDSRIF
ncbi:histidine phosphatase family protein [Microbulbifer yueqingensis]|uniref:Probable phosphoglycerate mutase n=1 Tax=Microbulbifer yueqingensis TaxID=658219 RepID=A0A1G9E5Q2_9GAMM|nr:histidine phosphatase family protein [Microbulbifer yueqingensis]SDK71407.1 probable phosphoglycerate mutase [Microbulbifer yueqingensis]